LIRFRAELLWELLRVGDSLIARREVEESILNVGIYEEYSRLLVYTILELNFEDKRGNDEMDKIRT